MRNFLLSLFFFVNLAWSQDYAKHVNPFIGTGGHGHTFPGATTPYGMVQLMVVGTVVRDIIIRIVSFTDFHTRT